MHTRTLAAAAVLATLVFSAPAMADENGTVGGAVTGAIGGAVVGGPIGLVVGGVGGVGGAVVGNGVTNHRPYYRGYAARHHPRITARASNRARRSEPETLQFGPALRKIGGVFLAWAANCPVAPFRSARRFQTLHAPWPYSARRSRGVRRRRWELAAPAYPQRLLEDIAARDLRSFRVYRCSSVVDYSLSRNSNIRRRDPHVSGRSGEDQMRKAIAGLARQAFTAAAIGGLLAAAALGSERQPRHGGAPKAELHLPVVVRSIVLVASPVAKTGIEYPSKTQAQAQQQSVRLACANSPRPRVEAVAPLRRIHPAPIVVTVKVALFAPSTTGDAAAAFANRLFASAGGYAVTAGQDYPARPQVTGAARHRTDLDNAAHAGGCGLNN